jgi:cytochrome c oxidase subunit 2
LEGHIDAMVNALAFLLQMPVPGVLERRVADIFKPLATPAGSEENIAILTLAITGVIFIVVVTLIAYGMVRFRRKLDEREFEEPPQIYGSNQIELAWTVIPILIVFVLIGVSARVIRGIENASPPPKATIHATIVGHQWWWEVHYPDYGVITANEIHVPLSSAGHNVTYFRLESADVIHSFWVPLLAGKTDLIPNRENFTWIDPSRTGDYVGNCAEYCGTQHANMLLRVIVQQPADFQKWVVDQAKPAVDDPSVRVGRETFEALSCVNCHTVKGTNAAGTFGPDLTHLASRETLGAGVLTNTPQHLRDWINDPQQFKPGCLMPNMKLDDGQLDRVVAYLETLK